MAARVDWHEIEPWEPEESIGKLWHGLASGFDSLPVHEDARVNLSEVMNRVPGITVHKIRKIGMNSSDTGHLFFDNVRVPQRNRVGHEGAGFMMQMLQFQEERLFGAANIRV